jgi:mono/diheme cytochrome c family protein
MKRVLYLCSTTALTVAFVMTASADQAQKSVWDGVYTDEQAKRGEALYQKYCAECHAESLTGQEQAPPLIGVSFASSWEGTPLSELFERMRTSMPEDNPGSLSRQENADVLAHMLKVGQFPAGSTPLSGDATLLSTIRYDSSRRTP